jgi:putative addiction module killer protein
MAMLIFEQTDEFANWLKALRDIQARAKISARLRIAQGGNLGDCQPVGEGVSEMRIHFGPGYRVYFTRTGDIVYLLLVGGDKSSQKRDIKHAIEMTRTLRKEKS